MSETKFNWNDLKLFLAVARGNGLAAAVTVTGKSAPTLGRRMLALEEVSGNQLFYRFARGYELTEHGTALLNRVIEIESKIIPLDNSAETEGKILVKISAGSWMTNFLCQNIDVILEGNSATRLCFISSEHILDIAHREAVIGIRNHQPQQIGLTQQKLGHVQFAGYATHKSVKSWVRVIGKTPSTLWLAEQADTSFQVEVTSPRNALDLAEAGRVRVLIPTFIGDANPNLIRVTTPIKKLAHDQWLVSHQDERFRPEVRLTIDRIYKVVRALHRAQKL